MKVYSFFSLFKFKFPYECLITDNINKAIQIYLIAVDSLFCYPKCESSNILYYTKI